MTVRAAQTLVIFDIHQVSSVCTRRSAQYVKVDFFQNLPATVFPPDCGTQVYAKRLWKGQIRDSDIATVRAAQTLVIFDIHQV